jgi:hypothetical protein
MRTASTVLVLICAAFGTWIAAESGGRRRQVLDLPDPGDRQAFRLWSTWLAETMYLAPRDRLPREITDCSALLRFACREALRAHTAEWAESLRLDELPPFPALRQPRFPAPELGAAIFRVRPGGVSKANFRQFADTEHLMRFNTHFVAKDIATARPGDLLFYRQLVDSQPYHSMIWLGRSHYENSRQDYVVYHTGPLNGAPGEIRRPSAAELLRHPEPRWRPVNGNSNFLGVFRWNFLRDSP